ncbi:MAG: hypothetical protein ACK50L_04120 [Bacteroidota bacterium]
MIEPIPYFYESINRNAIVIKPKKPLFDWINYLYPESPVTKKEEGTIYLIREKDSNEETEKWLKRNFDQIFQNELNDWYTDKMIGHKKELLKFFRNGLNMTYTQWF